MNEIGDSMKVYIDNGQIVTVEQNKPRYFTRQSYVKESLMYELYELDKVNSKVISAILRLRNDFNMVNTTAKELSDKIKVSLSTVKITMKAMQDGYYLRKFSNGRYMINPALVFKTNGTTREGCYAMFISDDKEVLDKIREIKQKRRG